MKNVELLRFPRELPLAQSAAGQWIRRLEDIGRRPGSFHVALSGGRIAAALFSAVAGLAQSRPRLFDDVHFFWADERCVPPTDPESNFATANDLLLRPLAVSAERIHRLRGEAEPCCALNEANSELRKIVPPNADGMPSLDLVFLGMGEDGHVASLFPGQPRDVRGGEEPYRLVENSPKPPPRRISFNYGLIAAAREVWILISGEGKRVALAESLVAGGHTPLGRVLQMRPTTRIFSDLDP